jgi:hypothetical protein
MKIKPNIVKDVEEVYGHNLQPTTIQKTENYKGKPVIVRRFRCSTCGKELSFVNRPFHKLGYNKIITGNACEEYCTSAKVNPEGHYLYKDMLKEHEDYNKQKLEALEKQMLDI